MERMPCADRSRLRFATAPSIARPVFMKVGRLDRQTEKLSTLSSEAESTRLTRTWSRRLRSASKGRAEAQRPFLGLFRRRDPLVNPLICKCGIRWLFTVD